MDAINYSGISNFKYTLFASGDSHFYDAVSIPFAEILNNDLDNDDSTTLTKDIPEYLYIDSRPTMDASIFLAGIVGVFAFFSSWLATKILDDIYETKFQPAIRRALGSADSKLDGANAKKPKMLQLGISYTDKQILILIGIIGETFVDILNFEKMFKKVHRSAVEWIENNSFTEPIHLYIVNHGKVNLEPLLFDNLMLAHRYVANLDLNSSEHNIGRLET